MSTIYGYTTRSRLNSQMLAQMHRQVDDLQRQLATGKRSDTYSGLGIGRGLDIDARSKLARVDTYMTAIDTVGLRINLMNSSLDRIRTIGSDLRSQTAFASDFELVDSGRTVAQRNALLWLDESLSLLNGTAGDRYLFSGRATDTRATDTARHILDGDGARAGLRQITAERLMADQGADGRGRVAAPLAAGSAVTLAEDGAHPFGFKLAAVTSDFGAVVTPNPGPPQSFEIDLGAVNPPPDGRVQVRLTLPDGSRADIELAATNQDPPPKGSFLIGADTNETAQHLAAALDAAIQQLARAELVAASAIQAGEDFFAIDAGNPPRRIDGPPFDTATALRDGTEADTVFWYTGDDATDDARGTAMARVDDTITVSYGARANEDGPRQLVQYAAVFAAMTFSASDPDARERYFALAKRVGNGLAQPDGVQKIIGIQTEIAGANLAGNAAKERLKDQQAVLHGIIDEIENVMPEEVGVMLLALNTRLQATLQTTAMLSRLTLLDYI